jgi:hypothetical protein
VVSFKSRIERREENMTAKSMRNIKTAIRKTEMLRFYVMTKCRGKEILSQRESQLLAEANAELARVAAALEAI